MSRDRQHRFRWETTRALGAAIRTICAPAPGTTLAGNDRPRAFPNRRPEVHNYPLGATSTPVFEKDLLRADGDGTGRSTHANQVLFAKYARSYIAINTEVAGNPATAVTGTMAAEAGAPAAAMAETTVAMT